MGVPGTNADHRAPCQHCPQLQASTSGTLYLMLAAGTSTGRYLCSSACSTASLGPAQFVQKEQLVTKWARPAKSCFHRRGHKGWSPVPSRRTKGSPKGFSAQGSAEGLLSLHVSKPMSSHQVLSVPQQPAPAPPSHHDMAVQCRGGDLRSQKTALSCSTCS